MTTTIKPDIEKVVQRYNSLILNLKNNVRNRELKKTQITIEVEAKKELILYLEEAFDYIKADLNYTKKR